MNNRNYKQNKQTNNWKTRKHSRKRMAKKH